MKFKFLSFALLTVSLCLAKHPKIASDLDNVDPAATVDVIVQFKQTPTAAHHQKVRDKRGRS